MLWGARGMGKSSLVKAAHAAANAGPAGQPGADRNPPRGHCAPCPICCACCAARRRRCLILCDDLSFEREDADYKALKSVLDGGIEGRPDNVLFYATSNRRHLMPRDMIENERSTAINPSEATEEKVSLSDRFGLWIGFHNCDQDTFFAMIEGYAGAFGLPIFRPRSCGPRRWNGQSPAAADRVGSPGSSSRTWRGDLEYQCKPDGMGSKGLLSLGGSRAEPWPYLACLESPGGLCRAHGSDDPPEPILAPLAVHPGGLGSRTRR